MVTNEDYLKIHEFRANALDRGDLIATSLDPGRLTVYLITGAGGGIGSVSRGVVELLLDGGQHGARDGASRRRPGRRDFASSAPRSSSAT